MVCKAQERESLKTLILSSYSLQMKRHILSHKL